LTWCLFPSNPTRRPPNAASARIRTRPTPRTTPSAGSTQALRGRAGRAALRTATPSVGTSGGHGGTGGHGVARDATWNIWGQETTRCWKNISLVTEWFPPVITYVSWFINPMKTLVLSCYIYYKP
jgi:hypothetical protein